MIMFNTQKKGLTKEKYSVNLRVRKTASTATQLQNPHKRTISFYEKLRVV
jgi:hypothetical protein